MTYKVRLSPKAQRDLQDFAEYTKAYSEEFSKLQFVRLNHILSVDLAAAPHMWSHFFVTGAPYRAFLFKVGRRSSYWFIYTVSDGAQTVDVLRFWNSSRDPEALEI
jgi:plasmid stabilization system protein ParE